MLTLLEQVKQRRIALIMKQHDMLLRVGMSRQQYQKLESKGNPRLDTLELIAKGLNSELMLIPHDKIEAVKAILATDDLGTEQTGQAVDDDNRSVVDDPWQGLLGDDE